MCPKTTDLVSIKKKKKKKNLQKAPYFSEDLYPLITLWQVAEIHIHHLPQGKSPLTVAHVQGDMVSTVPSHFNPIAEKKQILCLPLHPIQTITEMVMVPSVCFIRGHTVTHT